MCVLVGNCRPLDGQNVPVAARDGKIVLPGPLSLAAEEQDDDQNDEQDTDGAAADPYAASQEWSK